MKKIILLLISGFTTLTAIEFTMTKSGLYTTETTAPVTIPADGWVEAPLPTTAFNVLDYGLKGDGVTDDSAALNTLKNNTNVTNWYFPAGKSFLLTNVEIPSHIEAVYGGATIISKANASGYGAFNIDHADNDGLVIDGLNFTQENGVWSGTGAFGLLTFYGHINLSNFEIRNCDFQIPYFRTRAIKMFGSDATNEVINGVHIHHNTFTTMNEMAIEIFNYDTTVDSRSMINIHIHDNTFTSPSEDISLSFVGVRGGIDNTGAKDGTESYIYNNTFDGVSTAMEIGRCTGVYVHNNLATGVTGSIFSNSGGAPEIGMNFYYDNHLEGASGASRIYLYDSGSGEFYNNYINCRIEIDNHGTTLPLNYNFHDNTIAYDIGTESSSWTISPPIYGNVIWNNNEFYTSVNVSRIFYINSSKGGLDTVITNNTMNMTSPTGTAIDNQGDPITESGNTVTLDYSGTIPTSKPGAGLLP